MKRLVRAMKDPGLAFRFVKVRGMLAATGIYNAFVDLKGSPKLPPSGLAALDESRERSNRRTDINDHLVTLFVESLAVNPRLIVELGLRGGESTYVLKRVARLCRSKLVSVDLEDSTHACNSPDWLFIKSDDLEFSQNFTAWCRERKIEPQIDVLFIDTSHLFEHTCREIELVSVPGKAGKGILSGYQPEKHLLPQRRQPGLWMGQPGEE